MQASRVVSIVGVLFAGVASVATSAPDPDWTRDDGVSGDVTLSPDTEEVVVRVAASSHAVDSRLALQVALDPAPTRNAETADTPIVLYATITTAGTEQVGPAALPQGSFYSQRDGFDQVGDASVVNGADHVVYELHFKWTSPDPDARSSSKYDERTQHSVTLQRPLAPRRPMTIHWRANVHADGYDDAPAGASVDVEIAK